jgi:lipopolysaccharide export system permease protein
VKIIHRYVLREHAGPLTFALTALTSLLLLNYIAKQFGNLVGKGLGWDVIGEFFVLSIPFTVAMTLPMAIQIAALYAFSRLAAENEITALKASGVSIARLLLPVLGAAAVLSLFMVAFNDQVLPRANHQLRVLQSDIARKKPTFALREQVINEVAPGQFYLRANHLDEYSNRMREVTIWDMSDQLRRRTIVADSGNMALAPNGRDLQLVLYDGYMQETQRQEQGRFQRLFFKTDLIRVDNVANQFDRDTSDTYKSDREMSICELQGEVAKNETDYSRARNDLADALVAITREAATGEPASKSLIMPPPSSGSSMPIPRRAKGAKMVIDRSRSLSTVYCGMIAKLDKVGVPLLGVRAAHAEEPPQAAQQKQDTTKPKPDTTKQKPDSAKQNLDSAAQKPDTARVLQDSAASRPVPLPGAAQQTPAISPALSEPAILPSVPPAPTAASMDATVTALGAIEAARGRMVDSRSNINQNAVEIQKKFALSAACMVFVLIGAPIALRFPRGGVGLTMGVALGVFAIYYIGLIGGESLGNRGIVPPFVAMWLPNGILFALSLIMLARMGKETSTSRGGDLSEFFDSVRTLFTKLGRLVGSADRRRQTA